LVDNEEQPAAPGYVQTWQWVLQPVDISMAEPSMARGTAIQSFRYEILRQWDPIRGFSDEISNG